MNVQLFIEWCSLSIAIVSLIIAILSLYKSLKSQNLQNKVNDLEIKIKQHEYKEIEKKETETTCIEARVISISNTKHKLKVWNSGNTIAYNINVEIKKESNILILQDILPYEELEPNKSFEVGLLFSMSSLHKFEVTTIWNDSTNEQKRKTQICSL